MGEAEETSSERSPGRAAASEEEAAYRGEALAVRSILGGALMGLANLVPGISGGTMLLAAGVYPQFIRGVAEVSTLRLRPVTVLMLAAIAGSAGLAIVGLAGPISSLVVEQRWVMYSLFIGLTLGGVPILWRMVRPADSALVLFSTIGIALMAALAMTTPGTAGAAGIAPQHAMLFLAGLLGGSAMVLPGLSGGYLFLILGQYVTILAAIDAARGAVVARNWAILGEAMHVFVPVGLGAAIGVVGISNLIKLLLERFQRPTLGVLLGLLLGAVIGLWPFVRPVEPMPGTLLDRGTVVAFDDTLVFAETGRPVEAKYWPLERFAPTAGQVGWALALLAAGLLTSIGISHLGSGRGDRQRDSQAAEAREESAPGRSAPSS